MKKMQPDGKRKLQGVIISFIHIIYVNKMYEIHLCRACGHPL